MRHVISFEVRYRLRQVSTYLFFMILFCGAFFFVAGNSINDVVLNAPITLVWMTTIFTGLGGMMIAAIAGAAIYRDFECRAYELFFITRITKRDYFVGRFLGSFLVILGVFSGLLWGTLLGTQMPWIPAEKLQPFHLSVYLNLFCLFLLPNLFLISVLFFTLGALTRSLVAIYTQYVVLLVGYLLALTWLADLDHGWLASLCDPLGLTSTTLITRYWTTYEHNTLLIPLQGALLWNRVIWCGIALATFALGCRLFSFSTAPRILWFSRRTRAMDRNRPAGVGGRLSNVAPEENRQTASRPTEGQRVWQQYLCLTRSYLGDITRTTHFLIITVVGSVLLISSTLTADKNYGTSIYPVTRVIVTTIETGFVLFFLVLLTVYAGELTWKERVIKLNQIHDALPVSTGLTFVSKVSAVLAMQLLSLLGLIVTGVTVQAIKGYTRFELGLYFLYLYGVDFSGLFALTLLAFFVHALVNHKFLGHTLVIVLYILFGVLSEYGLDHGLYILAGGPTVKLSDMNGFGPFVAPAFWFTLYWTLGTGLLGIAAIRLSARGEEVGFRRRLAGAFSRRPAGVRAVTAIVVAGFVSTGAFIYYNTNVLNTFYSERGRKRLVAEYEKQYKRYAALPIPRITDVKLNVAIFPYERQYRVSGTYRVRNKTRTPLVDLPIDLDHSLTIHTLEFDRPAVRTLADRERGFYIYRLRQPLQPGEAMTLRFDLAYDQRGFPANDVNTNIVANGSFLSGITPALGYQERAELTDEDDRRKEGLPARSEKPAPDDPDVATRDSTYLGRDADWITFDATVSTAPDQIALAPGYLQREWVEGGRRYFHYVMDTKIRNFYTFLSARYAVRRDRWVSPQGNGVAIEIYYYPVHTYNLERMTRAVKRALDYDTANFGPYQFRQIRIVEFPCYRDFAQSFPNTIPYSEGIGFIARVQSARDIDYPFYVTAHEVAHQWWAHQVIGANVQGAEMLSESLAEYSALMVMQKEYGRESMRRFLRYDLDQYLEGRGADHKPEAPLMRVDGQQYIHYAKGSLALYALQDYIGEARLNAALARFLHDKGFQEPPYTTSAELIRNYLRPATPTALQYLITDLFEQVTLYDNRVRSATWSQIAPHRYHVRLTVEAKKLRADGEGKETAQPLHDAIDIGIFAPALHGEDFGKPLVLEKRTLTQPVTTLEYDVNEEPAIAGIDPYNKLIDRTPNDNTMRVQRR